MWLCGTSRFRVPRYQLHMIRVFTVHVRMKKLGYLVHTGEPCIRTAQSSRAGCGRRVHRTVYLTVKKGNILVNILLLKISSPWPVIVTYKSCCVSV